MYKSSLFFIKKLKSSSTDIDDQDDMNEDYVYIEEGVSLVPQEYRVYLQRRTPLLLNCSVNITDPYIHIDQFVWLRNGEPLEYERLKNRATLFTNGSLMLNGRRRKRPLDGLYECHVKTNWGTFIARRVHVILTSE